MNVDQGGNSVKEGYSWSSSITERGVYAKLPWQRMYKVVSQNILLSDKFFNKVKKKVEK